MKKNQIILLIISILSFSSYAFGQDQIDITWGDKNEKIKKKNLNLNFKMNMYKSKSTEYLYIVRVSTLLSHKYKNIILERYDNQLNLDKTVELDEAEKIFFFNDKIYKTSVVPSNSYRQFTLEITEIDQMTLKPNKSIIKRTVNIEKKVSIGYYGGPLQYSISEDKKKILIYYAPSYELHGTTEYKFYLFDNEFNILQERALTLEDDKNKMSYINNITISDKGDIHFISAYLTRGFNMTNYEAVNYKLVSLLVGKSEPIIDELLNDDEYLLNLQISKHTPPEAISRTIDIHIELENDNEITVKGISNNKENKLKKSIFIWKKSIDSKGFDSKKHYKMKNIFVDEHNYRLRKFITGENDTHYAIFLGIEGLYFRGIFVVKYDSEGNILWEKVINMNQNIIPSNVNMANYILFEHNNKLCFLFNEHEKNQLNPKKNAAFYSIKKANTVFVTLDEEGNQTKKILFNYKDKNLLLGISPHYVDEDNKTIYSFSQNEDEEVLMKLTY